MKYSLIALAATTLLSGSASARGHHHRRHAHPDIAYPSVGNDTCECSTYVTSYLVDVTDTPETGAAAPTTTVDAYFTVPSANGQPGSDVAGPSGAATSEATATIPATEVAWTSGAAGSWSSVIPVEQPHESTASEVSWTSGAAGSWSTAISVEQPQESATVINGNGDAWGSGVAGSSTTVDAVEHSPESTATGVAGSLSTVTPVEQNTESTTTLSVTEINTYFSTEHITVSLPSTSQVVHVTPAVTTVATPGTYTIPASTVVLTETETVCIPQVTEVPQGTYTLGGVTTIVETATTVVCPVAAVETTGDVTTTKVYETAYVCPEAGTYTIGATTTTVSGSTTATVEYPVPTEYAPGTYVQPEVVTTITRTSQVVVCPYSTVDAIATSNSVSPVEVPAATTAVSQITSAATEVGAVDVTPVVTTIATPGTYTIPASTVVLTETETVCIPQVTEVPQGTYTLGGVTTIVETATTVVCPVATVETTADVTTTKIYETTYVCPEAGTYTIGATTTTVSGSTTATVEYPVPTEYAPGTYVQPEVVTTITRTSQVVVCPYTSVDALATSTSPAEVPAATTEVAQITSTAGGIESAITSVAGNAGNLISSVVSEVTSADIIPSVTVSSTSVSVPAASSSSTAIAGSDGLFAMTYSPYNDDGTCKGADDVSTDIADIASKGFKNVRIYSTDCSGLENVGSACEKHGLGIILGVFIKAGGVSTADEQVQAIISWAKWDLVTMIVVGNEAIFNGYCTGAELAAYITTVRGQLTSAGYTGTITTSETVGIIQENASELCGVIDVIGCNIQPFFDGGVAAASAGEFLLSQLKLAEDACDGKLVAWALEAGWPSAGNTNGLAIASLAEQAIAIAAMEVSAPGICAYFTYRNDLWKTSGSYNVEQNFGCAYLF